MKIYKRIAAVLLAAVLLSAATLTACAAAEDTGFSDVAADAWYADAVAYVRENGLMSGVGDDKFAPEAVTARAMLATLLYRAAGSPAVSTSAGFTDVDDNAWYAAGANWAAENGIFSGYGNNRFGADDPITREQIAVVLWRYAGSPDAAAGENFADESAIAAYAADAVDWARANRIMNGKDGNRFDPQGNATRAEVAAILRNYLTMEQPDAPSAGSRILVAYYSASGNTEAAAKTIADALDADLLKLEPAEPYSSADLNYNDSSSRVVREHNNPELQDVALVTASVDNWTDYDTVFIGYPIWWGIAAWPVNDFVKSNDFTDKTVIPFCTSASSGLGQSGELLEEMAKTGNWLQGQRFRSRVSESDIRTWLDSLGIPVSDAE